MDQLINFFNFLISNDTSSTQTVAKPKRKRHKKHNECETPLPFRFEIKSYGKCNECNKRINRNTLDESHCHVCYKNKTTATSGNKVIDDFIKHTQTNYVDKYGRMEFVPFEQFEGVEFITEGGFSKIYKATLIDGPVINWNSQPNYTVVLKKLNNSTNITSKELNELKMTSQALSKGFSFYNECINECFGITQDPINQDVMFIMPYYKSGDLTHYVTNDFYNISWSKKLNHLCYIARGLENIHLSDIVHRDLHSGNIFIGSIAKIGDLGISKSATESTDDNNGIYGIIPYMAPEIFQRQKYTTASDVYSFGMIMWELMTGRRPFWDQDHDAELIIKICDGLRPLIVTNAPEGYIELMKECWHSDPMKRPTALIIHNKIDKIRTIEDRNPIKTQITKSSKIGPITINNPGAIFKSRLLSGMIQSAISLRSSRNQSINLQTDPFYYYQKNNTSSSSDKTKFEDNSIKDNDDNNGRSIKGRKLFEIENRDYFTKEIELDINTNFNQSNNNEYITKEIDLDINEL